MISRWYMEVFVDRITCRRTLNVFRIYDCCRTSTKEKNKIIMIIDKLNNL